MGKVFDDIDGRNARFIRGQHMFFVASAPAGGDGLVNLSPKGLDTFAILDPLTVAYLDLGGSGIETVAHVRENRRIVFMFCSFEGPPRILRLHGSAEVIEPGDDEWEGLLASFPRFDHVRNIIRARIVRVADSCGYGVPLYRHEGQRDTLMAWANRQGEEKLATYKAQFNAKSLDGLPGLRRV